MATMLLIGTNAWADVHATLVDGVDEAKVSKDGGNTWMYATHLKEAFDYVGYGETAEIVLLRSINVEAPITMPGTIPTYANGKGRLHEVKGQNITLNLNGKNITTTTNNVTPFRILKGSLDIEGSGIITKEHTNRYKYKDEEKVYGEPDWYGGAIVAISGAQDSLAADWSVLTIGKDVTLQFNRETGSDGKVLKSKAIAITNFAGLGWAKKASGDDAYNGTTYTQGEGTDFLARKYNDLTNETSAVSNIKASEQVDKFGYATRATKPTSSYTYSDNKKYTEAIWKGNADNHGTVEQIASAIAANKNFLPMGWGVLSGTNTFNKNTENETIYYYNILQGCAFGVKVIIEGTVSGSYYGVHFHGNINQTPEGLGETKTRHEAVAPYFTHQFPYLKVGKTATVSSAADGSCNGIYVAGYGVVDIEGEVYGATGVYMKSGDVVCKDANIRSTFTGEAEFNWGTNGDGGTHGAGGSAIVAETSDAYAGCMGVTIQGDTKVTGSTGYAIFDQTTVTTTTEGDVTTYSTTNHVTIEGGTIESGTLGTIAVTQGAVVATSISGGNVEGTTVTISNPDFPGQTVTIPTTDLISKGTHTTTVKDGTKTIVVVSQGAAPTDYDHVQGNANSVNWIGAGDNATETLSANLTLKELEINQDWVQTLTIPENTTLTVGRVVLGVNARIIVEAGGKFIVTGEQGIVAKKDINIKLESNATKQAIFLFNPGVSSNKHPNATVQYVATKSYRVSADDYQWERFGVPTWKALNSIECTTADVYSYVRVYENGWQDLGWIHNDDEFANLARMNKPFATYNMLTYVNDKVLGHEKATYVMTGELVGNMDATLNANLEWNAFTNSYSAEIDVKEMLLSLANANYIEKGVYTAQGGGNGTYTWDAVDLNWIDRKEDKQKLAPMQAFILRNEGLIVEDFTLDYEKMVWDPVMDPNHQVASVSGAPRRAGSADDESARLRIIVANEQGTWDNVKLTENATASSLKKYMNDDVNIYAMADEKAAIVAAEDLEDSYFGFSTVKGGEFTISFADVEGREFDLIDLETGVKVAVMEGEAYSFAAAANTVADYRFKLVERAKMPTSIENTEAVKSVKGIYTITGQYLGEMNVWNTLPAGVYVVNGEKLVK